MEFLDLDGKEDEEIICEVFDLNQLQQQIFEEIRNQQLTVQEIASEVDRNRSTVQRSLQEMMQKDLIMREGKTDKTVYYVYTTLPMEQIKDITLEILDDWYKEVNNKLS